MNAGNPFDYEIVKGYTVRYLLAAYWTAIGVPLLGVLLVLYFMQMMRKAETGTAAIVDFAIRAIVFLVVIKGGPVILQQLINLQSGLVQYIGSPAANGTYALSGVAAQAELAQMRTQAFFDVQARFITFIANDQAQFYPNPIPAGNAVPSTHISLTEALMYSLYNSPLMMQKPAPFTSGYQQSDLPIQTDPSTGATAPYTPAVSATALDLPTDPQSLWPGRKDLSSNFAGQAGGTQAKIDLTQSNAMGDEPPDPQATLLSGLVKVLAGTGVVGNVPIHRNFFYAWNEMLKGTLTEQKLQTYKTNYEADMLLGLAQANWIYVPQNIDATAAAATTP
jgi:hypothetical protein